MTKEWADAHESGRLVGLDRLVLKFQEADYQGELKLLQQVRAIQKFKKETNDNSESADYYSQVMSMIVEKGWGFVAMEEARVVSGVSMAKEQATEENMESQMSKVRLLNKWKSILDQYQPLYMKPLQPGQSLGLAPPAQPSS